MQPRLDLARVEVEPILGPLVALGIADGLAADDATADEAEVLRPGKVGINSQGPLVAFGLVVCLTADDATAEDAEVVARLSIVGINFQGLLVALGSGVGSGVGAGVGGGAGIGRQPLFPPN